MDPGSAVHRHERCTASGTRGCPLCLLCTCTERAKPPIWAEYSPEPPSEVLAPLESQPESPLDLPQDPPREPVLTLPGVLTAYVALIAVVHLRVLLPPGLENWAIYVFGFIPKRYDSTLLDLTFPGGTGAKIW